MFAVKVDYRTVGSRITEIRTVITDGRTMQQNRAAIFVVVVNKQAFGVNPSLKLAETVENTAVVIDLADFFAIEIDNFATRQKFAEHTVEKACAPTMYFAQRNAFVIINVAVRENASHKLSGRIDDYRLFVQCHADNPVGIIGNQIVGIKFGFTAAGYRNFAVFADNVKKIAGKIISIAVFQNLTHVAAVLVENIAVSSDAADRQQRCRLDNAVSTDFAEIFAVISDSNAGTGNTADNFAGFVQHRTVRIDAADVIVGGIADNAVGPDLTDKRAGIVKRTAGLNDFADIRAGVVNNNAVRHNLIGKLLVAFGYFTVFIKIADVFAAITDHQSAAHQFGDDLIS